MLYAVLGRSISVRYERQWAMQSGTVGTSEFATEKLDSLKCNYPTYEFMLVKITGVEFIPASEREVEIPA